MFTHIKIAAKYEAIAYIMNKTPKNKARLSALPTEIAEYFSASNIFLSNTATVGNALVLISLKNVSSTHPLTNLFF